MLWLFTIYLQSLECSFLFLSLRSRKTVRFTEQLMSADKCPSIFSHQMEAIAYILSAPVICYIEKNSDITSIKRAYFASPWPFVVSKFHCKASPWDRWSCRAVSICKVDVSVDWPEIEVLRLSWQIFEATLFLCDMISGSKETYFDQSKSVR